MLNKDAEEIRRFQEGLWDLLGESEEAELGRDETRDLVVDYMKKYSASALYQRFLSCAKPILQVFYGNISHPETIIA